MGFIAMVVQPHRKYKKLRRVSRLVILPDYQGIGLGYKFLDSVARHYAEQGVDVSITTSAKNMVSKLARSDMWSMGYLEVKRYSKKKSVSKLEHKKSVQRKCKVAGFVFKRGNVGNG